MNFTPVNLTQGFPAILHEWVFAQNCTCPSGTYCVRPKHYSKPVACLANNIPAHLFNNLLANPAEFVEKSGQDFLPILLGVMIGLQLITLLLMAIRSLIHQRTRGDALEAEARELLTYFPPPPTYDSVQPRAQAEAVVGPTAILETIVEQPEQEAEYAEVADTEACHPQTEHQEIHGERLADAFLHIKELPVNMGNNGMAGTSQM